MKAETLFLSSQNGIKIFSSSNIEECPVENLLNPNLKVMWFSEESLPQQITFDLTQMINRPVVVRGLGVHCWNSYDTNPKIIEVLIAKQGKAFISLGNYELSLTPGTQVLSTEEILFGDIAYLKLVIKETFGGSRTYLNKIYLYDYLPETETVALVTDSRERNMPYNKATRKSNDEENPPSVNKMVLNTRTTDMLLSESELSEKRGKPAIISNGNQDNDEEEEDMNNNAGNKAHESSIDIPNNNLNNMNIIDNARDPQSEDEENKLVISDPQFETEPQIDKYIPTATGENNTNNIAYSSNEMIIQMRNLELANKSNLEKFDKRIVNLEGEISVIKEKMSEIAQHLSTIASLNNAQMQKNFGYVVEECNKRIDNKIGSIINSNGTMQDPPTRNKKHSHIPSLNTSMVSKRDEYYDYEKKKKAFHFEETLHKKIEEKFNIFTKELENKIYNSLLKPTFEHLESNLEINFNEVKNQIRTAKKKHYYTEKKAREKSYKKNYHTENKKSGGFTDKVQKLDQLINKFQDKLNAVEHEKIFPFNKNSTVRSRDSISNI